MTRKLATLLIVASLGLVTALPSRAGDITLVSNLSAPFSVYGTVQAEDALNQLPGFTIAQQFTSGVATTLTLIQAELGGLDTGSFSDFQLHADLYADNGGLPTGTHLASFVFNQGDISTGTDVSDAKVIDFTPDSTVALAAGVGYWFVLSATSGDGGGVNWFVADDFTQVGAGNLPSYTQQVDSQGWDPPSAKADQFPQYLLAAYGASSAIPEPSSWVLGSIGCGFLALASRRSRSRRRVA